MNRSSVFAQITSTLLLMMSGLIAGFAAPAHCQQAERIEAAAKAQLTAASWVPTGNLNTARTGHTATLLPNGKVLVVGGFGAGGRLGSAELYDPSTGAWSVTGGLNHGRGVHSATLLPDGQVLVAGGFAGDSWEFSETAELYDPSTATWTLTGNMSTSRAFHSATLLQTGKVLIAGGNGPQLVTICDLYDPATGTWSQTGSIGGFGRDLPQATLLQDGRVLLTGGTYSADFIFGLPSAELYDPVAGIWSRTPDLHIPRLGHSATLLPNGTVLVAGGDSVYPYDPYFGKGPIYPPNNSAELFDPTSGNWSITGSLKSGRGDHTATLLPNGEVLVAGGYTYTPPGPGGAIKSAEQYDVSVALWRDTGDLNTARIDHTATLLPSGRVLVAGGSGAGGGLNSTELYGPTLPPGIIGSGFTGAWYDPAQSGHGIFVQILSDQRFYAAWFAFNPAGTEQAWFTGVGTYSGNTATITAVEQPAGGQWIPNFNPSRIVRNPWGTLTFTFTDCDHGKVDFDSVSGYGSGSVNLTRLTHPAGLSCQ